MKKLLIIILVTFIYGAICIVGGVKTADYYRGVPITGIIYSIGNMGSGLEQFGSLEELEEWLVFDDTNEYLIMKADEEGVISFSGVCEDYAMQLQERALADGYKMSFYYVDRIEMWQRFRVRLERGKAHAMNLTIIGNYIYIIEPATDGITHIAYLD